VTAEVITARPARDVAIVAASEALTVTSSRYGPGERGPDPHVHREHTDAFYVLAGTLVFAVGLDLTQVEAGPGTYVSVPPGVMHTFWNAGADDARFLNVHAPDAGFAAFMRGARDGVTVLWDSFAAPDDGGAPTDGVVVTRT
jgi:mannose-6-phosphate isomerase-like protein (cupin superfamily)